MADEEKIHLLLSASETRAEASEDFTEHPVMPEADRFGNVLLRRDLQREATTPHALGRALSRELTLLDTALGHVEGAVGAWDVEKIKVSLALEVKAGELVAQLVGGAGVKGAIEVELKRGRRDARPDQA